VPRRILHASRFLNACYAAFVDHQFAGALAASVPYIQMGAMERGLKLFQLWSEQTQNLTPGAEYEVIDTFAAELRLREWFSPSSSLEGTNGVFFADFSGIFPLSERRRLAKTAM
jgi:hypothetical protein